MTNVATGETEDILILLLGIAAADNELTLVIMLCFWLEIIICFLK